MLFGRPTTRSVLFRRHLLVLGAVLTIGYGADWLPVHAADGELELTVRDSETNEWTAARIELRDARGRVARPTGGIRVGDAIAFDGRTVLGLRTGAYTFRMEKGPEYRVRQGHFEIQRGAADHHEVQMQRFVDMAAEGWWSGDLEWHIPARQTPLMMLSEDIRFAPLVTRSSAKATPSHSPTVVAHQPVGTSRQFVSGGIQLDRSGSDVFLFPTAESLEDPFSMQDGEVDAKAPWVVVRTARDRGGAFFYLGAVVDWDLPFWLAVEPPDCVGLLHAGIGREGSINPPTTRPPDPTLFPAPWGPGRWAQQVYFQVLEAGYRVAPGASSGAGRTNSPPGFNRVYVYCGDRFSPASWWDGLRAGRVVITNGPLLRPFVNGQPPGHVFSASAGETLELRIELKLGTQEKVRYLEVIQNGRAVHQVRLEDWAAGGGKLPDLPFRESGWLLVRAVTENADSYRMAASGPYYVEFDGQPRISKQAAEFFLDWLTERARQLSRSDPERWSRWLPAYREARDHWQRRVERANVP